MVFEAFGSYTVIRALSRGGPVEVYEARDPQLDRRVAIKVLHPPAGSDRVGFEQRFRELARRSAGLRHEHIVQMHGFDVAGDLPYLAMEYLEGGTLAERIAECAGQNKPMSLPEVARILEPLADALDALHAQGLVHGGLSPANVIFTTRGKPVLTDIGIAQLLGPVSLTNPAGAGPAAYASPEQAAGKPVTAASDIYGLGLLIYEMACGRPPFAGAAPAEVMLQHLTEPPPDPGRFKPDLPKPVAAVLLKALAKEPAARFVRGRDLVAAFAAAARGEEAAAAGAAEGEPGAPESDAPRWLAPLIDFADLLGPLVGRTPSVRGAPRDRRGQVATILGVIGIVLAAFQFLNTVFSMVTVNVAPLVAVLPYLIAALLVCGGVLALLTALRPGPPLRRRRATAVFAATAIVGVAWGGWTLYDRIRPPPGVVVAVADFQRQGTRVVEFGQHIYDALRPQVADTGGDIILERTFQTYADQASAQRRGNEHKATLVIWGTYDNGGVSPHVEVLRFPTLGQPPTSPLEIIRSASAASSAAPSKSTQWSLSKMTPYVRQPVWTHDFDLFVKDGAQQMTYISMVLLGLIYYANGDNTHTLAFYDKALGSAPSSSDIMGLEVGYFQRATLLYRQGKQAEAIADLRQALAIKPDMVEAHRNLAILYASACAPDRQLDEAVAEAQTAARLQPDNVEGRQLLADLYREAGQHGQALAELQAAEKLEPRDTRTQQLMAAVYEQSGRPDEARAAAERALALFPPPPAAGDTAEAAEAHLSRGTRTSAPAASTKRWPSTMPRKKPCPRTPGRGAAWATPTTGRAATQTRPREYSYWVSVAPDDANAHLMLGMVLREQGDDARTARARAGCGVGGLQHGRAQDPGRRVCGRRPPGGCGSRIPEGHRDRSPRRGFILSPGRAIRQTGVAGPGRARPGTGRRPGRCSAGAGGRRPRDRGAAAARFRGSPVRAGQRVHGAGDVREGRSRVGDRGRG